MASPLIDVLRLGKHCLNLPRTVRVDELQPRLCDHEVISVSWRGFRTRNNFETIQQTRLALIFLRETFAAVAIMRFQYAIHQDIYKQGRNENSRKQLVLQRRRVLLNGALHGMHVD